jgi:hypothetical protein
MATPTSSKPVDAPHDVIEMKCSVWVRWGMGDSDGFMKVCGTDRVNFDPGL